MEQITFDHVIPKVFATVEDLNSETWNSTATFKRGGLYLVEAASGKGKSTFCSYVIGYRNDYTGKILFDNDDIKDYKSGKWSELRRNSISHLFQELRLFPELTAMENVLINNQLTQHSETEKILSWFERLGIPEKTDQKIGMMSFGQQQRVAMMRALAQPFDVLLVDEPISHLDDYNSQIMADIMMEEAKKQNACVIVTSIGKHMNLPYDKTYKL